MPTYEYRCSQGHDFELFQRMSDEPSATCPECGAEAQRLLSGGAGVLFKGDGFYITDYRSSEYKKAAQAEGSTDTPKSGEGRAKEKGAGDKGPGGSTGSAPSSKPSGDSGAGKPSSSPSGKE